MLTLDSFSSIHQATAVSEGFQWASTLWSTDPIRRSVFHPALGMASHVLSFIEAMHSAISISFEAGP